MLRAVPNIPIDEAHVHSSQSKYIALASLEKSAPLIPWTLFRAVVDNSVSEGVVKVNTVAFSDIPVQLRDIEPLEISHIVLTAPAHIFPNLGTQDIAAKLPSVVRAGTYIEALQCRIKACEPVDQGVLAKNTTISVVCERSTAATEQTYICEKEVEIQEFLQHEKHSLSAKIMLLERPLPPMNIQPLPSSMEDLENSVFLRVDQVARLGVFSGGTITIKTKSETRVVRLYAYPEPNTVGEELYVPPMLSYNLGSPDEVELFGNTLPLPVAKDVVISRIASPISTDRTFQSQFLSALRSYFEQCNRVVRNNDVIAIPIDTILARTLYLSGGEEDSNSIPVVQGSMDSVVWFKISGLSEDTQFIIDHNQTRIVQSGFIQQPHPPATLGWMSYYAIRQLPPLFSYGESNFRYVWKIRKLLKSAVVNSMLQTTILMTSSKRGAGKSTTLSVAAANLGIHELCIDCYDIMGDSDVKTIGTLKAKLERALTIQPCLVVLRHIDAIAKKNDQDGRDPNIASHLSECLAQYIASGLIIAATVAEPDALCDTIRNRFKFEVDVTVPTETERKCVLHHLTSKALQDVQLSKTDDALVGYALRNDIMLDSLALQSAGLTPPDLESIIRVARQQANLRASNDSNMIISQRGIIKITLEDIESAISDARSKFSDSIGAPKIPNVTWKDVGGLDNVKGEIMDTIEMPLKYPQLFSSGVKKRSGILFYGPPGTGKTLMAKAIATSFSLNFFSVKGPELLNMYIGESEANVRRVFQKARDAKPCVIFFDELDSVAPKRGNQGDSGGVMDRIVSQLLAELDGMSEGADGVFVIGATNRPDLLDEALLRPGRFDKLLYLGVSDTHEKQNTILAALTRKFDLAQEVDLKKVADSCPLTYTGADFYAMSSDAMLNAMTRTAGEVDAKIAALNTERAQNGQPPVTIRTWFEHFASKDDSHVLVSEADFMKAREQLVPSVSAGELAHYQKIRELFEGSKSADGK